MPWDFIWDRIVEEVHEERSDLTSKEAHQKAKKEDVRVDRSIRTVASVEAEKVVNIENNAYEDLVQNSEPEHRSRLEDLSWEEV